MRHLTTILALVTALGCTSSNQVHGESNTSLVVTYNGKEVYRRNTKWISLDEFASLQNKKTAIIIFGAEWCKVCETLRTALTQLNLKEKIYYVNIDEPWMREVMVSTNIKKIPIMFHLTNGKADMAKVGPSEIIMWLLINKESK